jgi:hypothetical protein
LGEEKAGKALNTEFAESLRKELRKIGEEETIQEQYLPDPSGGGPYAIFPLSPLFA